MQTQESSETFNRRGGFAQFSCRRARRRFGPTCVPTQQGQSMTGPSKRPARPIRAEEKWAVSKWPPVAAPKPSAVPVHPSLMRQFQSHVRGLLRLEQSPQILGLETETVSLSLCPFDVRDTSGVVPTVPRSANVVTRVPRPRDLVRTSRMHNVVLFPPLVRWLGPRHRTCHGEGMGG
jgi:hypothetical protein